MRSSCVFAKPPCGLDSAIRETGFVIRLTAGFIGSPGTENGATCAAPSKGISARREKSEGKTMSDFLPFIRRQAAGGIPLPDGKQSQPRRVKGDISRRVLTMEGNTSNTVSISASVVYRERLNRMEPWA